MNKKTKRGRPTEAPLTARIFARVTEAEHAKYLAFGGSEWLRKQLASRQEHGDVRRLQAEHAEWASKFGAALMAVMQEDYGPITELAMSMPFDFHESGSPTLRSAALSTQPSAGGDGDE